MEIGQKWPLLKHPEWVWSQACRNTAFLLRLELKRPCLSRSRGYAGPSMSGCATRAGAEGLEKDSAASCLLEWHWAVQSSAGTRQDVPLRGIPIPVQHFSMFPRMSCQLSLKLRPLKPPGWCYEC